MTTAVVLAAGLGRRLAAASPLPKWLTPVGPEVSPAEAQLGGLERAGIGSVLVVVNPWATEIEERVAAWGSRLDISLVVNDHAAERNNWYSLLLGLDAAAAGAGGDVVVLNSDLFADTGWLAGAVAAVARSPEPAALAIDPARGRTDEAMKVGLDASGARITGIGKVGVATPGGEYVGLAWWSAAAATGLRAVLRGFLETPGRADHWYEHGIQEHLLAGAAYAAVPVPSSDWVEIDDLDDLEAARRIPLASLDSMP